jgi:uncharacterized protein YfdQ (DUF2303 family)
MATISIYKETKYTKKDGKALAKFIDSENINQKVKLIKDLKVKGLE